MEKNLKLNFLVKQQYNDYSRYILNPYEDEFSEVHLLNETLPEKLDFCRASLIELSLIT